tara:strand:- start:484 stop:1992 length:1509 start_codon:yes stop_codon:yes gene_type:complete
VGRGVNLFMLRLLLIIFPIILFSEPDILWFEEFSGSGEESIGHFILTCEDNGFLQVGETYNYSNLSSKILIVKINASGQFLWSREISIGEHNLGNSAIELNDGYLICGGLDQNSALIKLDKEDGSTMFLQTFDNGGTDAFENVSIVPNGFFAVGYVHSEDPFNSFYTEGEGFAMFLDENGIELSSQNLSQFIDQAYRVQTINNELIISGLSEGASDYKVMKMSLDGNVIWHYSYGGTEEDHCFGMDVNDEGHIFLAGHTLSGTQNWDTFTVKIDNDGNLIWTSTKGNPRGFNPIYIHDEAWGVKATNDGGCVVIAGTGDEYDEYSECNGQDCSDVWSAYLIKYNEFGDVSWQKTFSSFDVSEEIYDWAGEAIDLTYDGGGIIAIDNGQFGFLRLNNIQNTLSNDLRYVSPPSFKLYNNHPNPFNPVTTIEYELPENGLVSVTVYDIIGNVVNNLVNTNQSFGYKSVQWNATNNQGEPVSAGVYLYSIEAGNFRQTKKMILLK